MADMKKRKTSNAYTRSETSGRQSHTNEAVLNDVIESNTENEGRERYYSKRKNKRSWGRSTYSKRARSQRYLENDFDDDYRKTVDGLFDFISKINKHAKKFSSKKIKKKKTKETKKKNKYEKNKKKKQKIEPKKDTLYRFRDDSTNLNLQDFIHSQNGNPLLYQMMLNTGYANANDSQGVNHYTQNIAKINELMNQVYSVYGRYGQNQQNINMDNIIMQLNPQLRQNPEILRTFKAMMQGNVSQMSDMATVQHQNVNQLYRGQAGAEGFNSINKFPLPKAAYHVGIAYHIWYKEGNLDKDPTQYARKKSHMGENQNEKSQENQGENVIQENQTQETAAVETVQQNPQKSSGKMEEEEIPIQEINPRSAEKIIQNEPAFSEQIKMVIENPPMETPQHQNPSTVRPNPVQSPKNPPVEAQTENKESRVQEVYQEPAPLTQVQNQPVTAHNPPPPVNPIPVSFETGGMQIEQPGEHGNNSLASQNQVPNIP